MANGECVACHARATVKPTLHRALSARTTGELLRASWGTTSAQDRSIFSREERMCRRLNERAWRNASDRASLSARRLGSNALADVLRAPYSAMSHVDMGGRTRMRVIAVGEIAMGKQDEIQRQG